MIDHVNNYNGHTISHEKCLPASICKIITHKITKKEHHMFTVTHNQTYFTDCVCYQLQSIEQNMHVLL